MNAQLRNRLSAEVSTGAIAYVRNLIAAEAAILRGQFNVAKILRAAAHTQRTLAMNAARMAGAEQDPSSLFETILDELQSGLAIEALVEAENEQDLRESVSRSATAQRRLSDIMQRSIDSLNANSDVLESDVHQYLHACYSCGNIVSGGRPDECDVCGVLETEFESFAPFYSLAAEHLGQRTPDEILAILEATPEQVAATLAGVDEAVLNRKPSADEWHVKELIGHLVETDEQFTWRVEAILGEPSMPDVDWTTMPWEFHEGKGYEKMSGPELIERLKASHAKSLAAVQDLTPEQWRRRGAMLNSSRSLIDLGTWLANHDLGHLAQIRGLCQAQ